MKTEERFRMGWRSLMPLLLFFACATVPKGMSTPPVLAPSGADAKTAPKTRTCTDKGGAMFIGPAIAATGHLRVRNYAATDGMNVANGTGVIIDKKGLTLTAYHVVKDAEFVSMTLRTLDADGKTVKNGREIPMRIVAIAADKDVALLAPKYPETIPEHFSVSRKNRVRKGATLWQFGQTTSWACGEVLQPSTYSEKVPVIELEIAADFGDSGGPLVTPEGRLIGLLLTINKEAGRAYFVPIGDALDALERTKPKKTKKGPRK